jgi:F-type H+-transporting ATPase subunit a
MLEISLAAEKIGSIGPFPVTNSLLSTWIVMAILIGLGICVSRSITLIPSSAQSITEMVISGLHDFFESVMGPHVKKAFPVLASLFLFIILANWLGLLPGVGTIGLYEEVKTEKSIHTASYKTGETPVVQESSHDPGTPLETSDINPVKKENGVGAVQEKKKFIPLLRGATADLNTTIALAIVSFFAIQYFGFATLGVEYSKRFLNFSNPIMFFVGLLEIISDLSKVISFAFRLFGNIFAGEVLLAVMAFLMPFVAPMPFLLLELFVGFIQALVFSTLTAVFINVAVVHEE